MITFETQEDFEEAVKHVIRHNLSVYVTDNSDGYDWNSKRVRVELLLDRSDVISSDSVSI